MTRLMKASEPTASRRRVYFQLVDATDGITPETGEASGQPQISVDGAAWTNTGIGTLTAIGNGRYYAELTSTIIAAAGTIIETRYKSANTAECPGDTVQVVGFDPADNVRMGMTALPNAAADAAGGLPISDGGGLDLDELASDTSSAADDLATLLTRIVANPEASLTQQQTQQIMLAVLAGKISGAGTDTLIIRNVSDTHDLITATVDADGNRSAITISFPE